MENCYQASDKEIVNVHYIEVKEIFMSEWNALLYDNKHDFVAEYGKGLLEFVPVNNNQTIMLC